MLYMAAGAPELKSRMMGATASDLSQDYHTGID